MRQPAAVAATMLPGFEGIARRARTSSVRPGHGCQVVPEFTLRQSPAPRTATYQGWGSPVPAAIVVIDADAATFPLGTSGLPIASQAAAGRADVAEARPGESRAAVSSAIARARAS